MYPNFIEEKKLWRQGFDVVVGLDEVGRGPLAGPVVAAAVIVKNPNDQIPMTNKTQNSKFKKIGHWSLGLGALQVRDSKQLSQKRREEIYEIITKHPAIEWGIGVVSEKIIDKINILEATKLAMQKALNDLYSNFNDRENYSISGDADFLLLDGNFKIKTEIPQKSIIKGDQKVFSISAASIIAKVTRDRIMQKMHKKFPDYGFEKHKGYGTALHIKNLQNFGPCKIHRKTFYPVSSLLS